jgi:hypothetical protein
MANPLSFATVNHICAVLGIAYVSLIQRDLVLEVIAENYDELARIATMLSVFETNK